MTFTEAYTQAIKNRINGIKDERLEKEIRKAILESSNLVSEQPQWDD